MMTGKIIPLSSHDSFSDGQPENNSLLTDEDVRLITALGDKLISDGRASAVRRFTGDKGKDVMVILDEKGVIEFGIERSGNGYKGFNCDCDTVATARDLPRLLARLS